MTNTKFFLKTFYFVLTLTLFTRISFDSSLDLENHVYAYGKTYFDLLGSPQQSLNLLLLLSIISSAICIISTNLITQLISTTLTISFFIGLMSQYKIIHSSIVWIFLVLFFLLLDKSKDLLTERNIIVLRLAQVTILTNYFNSGIWKFKTLLQTQTWTSLKENTLNNYAYVIAEGKMPLIQLYDIQNFELVFTVGYLLVVLFQLISGFIIFKMSWIKHYGIIAFLFHLSTGLFMEIWFFDTAIAALFCLTLAEYIKSYKYELAYEAPEKSD